MRVEGGGVGVERWEREKESGWKGGWEGEAEDLWLLRVRRRLCRLMLVVKLRFKQCAQMSDKV